MVGLDSSEGGSWAPVRAGSLSEEARQAVFAIAERLQEPNRSEVMFERWSDQLDKASNELGGVRWLPESLASGHVSLALFFGQLERCFPGQGWEITAHRHLERAALSATEGHLGLFNGLAGLRFAAHLLSKNGSRYKRLSTRLDDSLCEYDLVPLQAGRPAGLVAADYDLIAGCVGVGTCLLSVGSDGGTLRRITDVLLSRIESDMVSDNTPLLIPGSNIANALHRRMCTDGCTDCGMAHGVGGVLAFLSLVLAAHPADARVKRAVEMLAGWLVERPLNADGPVWPICSGAGAIAGTLDAWCYGSAGVCRALWLAGTALGSQEVKDQALRGMRRIASSWSTQLQPTTPCLCHGIAGVAEIALRFANETGESYWWDFAHRCSATLMGFYDPGLPILFQNSIGGSLVDDPGFLTGSAGIGLHLLAATTSVEPTWDRLLLIS